MDHDQVGSLQASDPTIPIVALRERLAEQGYLWLRGLLPRTDVQALRQVVLERFAAIGLLEVGSDPARGIAARRQATAGDPWTRRLRRRWPGTPSPEPGPQGAADPVDPCQHILFEVVRSREYDAFCRQAHLWTFMEALLDGPVHLHQRRLIRFTKPGEPSATGAHYDRTYLRGGTGQVVTAWIPLGDTPMAMGGLIYLEGSDQLGQQMEMEFQRAHAQLAPDQRLRAFHNAINDGGWITQDLAELAKRLDRRWLSADYAAGDVVLHSAHIIHASPDNLDSEHRLRLSTDIRFQSARKPIDQRWSRDWSINDGL